MHQCRSVRFITNGVCISFTAGQHFSVRVLYFIRLLVAYKSERNRKHQLARTSRKCAVSPACCVWLFCQYSYRSTFFFASNLSCSGNNHVSSLFTNEEQERKKREKKKKEKKAGSWRIWYFCHTCQHSLSLHHVHDNKTFFFSLLLFILFYSWLWPEPDWSWRCSSCTSIMSMTFFFFLLLLFLFFKKSVSFLDIALL